MAKTVAPLTDTQIKKAKQKEKDYKLFDGGGLYLLVTKAGGKHWKLKYRFGGKEKLLSLGSYPAVSLKEAREARERNRTLIAQGSDPNAKKKEAKEEEIGGATFKEVALHRLETIREDISESHYKRTLRGFVNDTFPYIGDKEINSIAPKDIIALLNKMMDRGVRNATEKVYQQASKTFKYAVCLLYTSPSPRD